MTTSYVDFAGYRGCIALENAHTRVVLGQHCGGRVLEYAYRGESALMRDPRDDGQVYTPGQGPVGMLFPTGGRFDIGPEQIIPDHPELWLGPWQAEIVGEWTARMTSAPCSAVGVRLVREFTLDARSSHLTCTQTMENVSDRITRWCYWCRTFGRGHGICVVPLTPELSRYPNQYVMYGLGSAIGYAPEDPAIRRQGDFLVVYDTPAQPKLGLDTYAGWFAYLMPNDLLFVKRYPADPERVYHEVAGLTLSLWYYQDVTCELEPIGPRETLAPGASCAFTEEWWLLPYPFPKPREALDVADVARAARDAMGG